MAYYITSRIRLKIIYEYMYTQLFVLMFYFGIFWCTRKLLTKLLTFLFSSPLCTQGYIEQAPVPLFDGQYSTCDVTPRYHDVSNGETTKIGCVREELGAATLTIISRRSKYRAGTRFKRRGIDNNGETGLYLADITL